MVSAVFNRAALKGGIAQVRDAYKKAYAATPAVQVNEGTMKYLDFSRFDELNKENASTPPQETLDIHVNGWEDADGKGQVRVTALLDNLGKGAGTQAVQNIKLMLDL